MLRVRPLEVAFKCVEETVQLQLQIMERDWFQDATDLSLWIRGKQVREMQLAWFALLRHAQDADHVQSQQCEVREIVLAERLLVKMSANEPEAAQRMGADPKFGE